ncbi:MAG: GntR family transcriptional regulator [Spirochaetes bacterium]|nr:GntR family transcriptional regulator [Spirochaetota bacterium]
MPSIPRYQRIHDEWARKIRSGRVKTGDRLPTEDELAARYGVSKITVIRALKDLVHDGLVERRQGRGSFARAPLPLEPAVGLAFSSVLELGHPHVLELMAGAEAAARRAGVALHLLPVLGRSLVSDGSVLRRLLDERLLCGLLLASPADPVELESLMDRGVPCVSVGVEYRDFSIPTVAVDYLDAFQDLLGPLIADGFTRIGLLTGPLEKPDVYTAGAKCARAWTSALTAAGLPVDPSLHIPGDQSVSHGETALERLLERGVEAVLVLGDPTLRGVLQKMRERGLDPNRGPLIRALTDTAQALPFLARALPFAKAAEAAVEKILSARVS